MKNKFPKVSSVAHKQIKSKEQLEKNLYQKLVEHSIQGIVIFQNKRIVFANKTMKDISGFSVDELLSFSADQVREFIHPADREQVWKRMQERVQGKDVPSRYVFRALRKDKKYNWLEMYAALIEYQGKPAVQGALIKITEQKQAEAELLRTVNELKNSEERLKILFEYAPDAYYLNDLKGRFLDGNKAAEALTGYCKEELIGQSMLKLNILDQSQIKKAAVLLSKNAKGIATGPDEFVLTRKDGSKMFVEISTYPVKIRNRVQVLGIARDITEQHKSMDALRKSEEKFRNLAEKSPNMIFINKRGRVVYANKKCEEIMGYSVDEFLSPDFNFFNIIAPESKVLIKTSFNHHLRGEEVPPYEYSLITKQGKRIEAIITTKLIPYDDDTAILGIVTDIGERKKAEERIKLSLKEKEVMLREIHHRVKNNMQIITSLLRLQAGQTNDNNIQKMFHLCQNRIKSMSLIHESLYQSQDLTRINFSDYIQKITTHLLSVYSQKQTDFDIQYDLEDVYLDINRAIPFGLIINELITNALKHAFPKGKPGEIKLKLRQNKSGQVTLKVEDNGIGFPESVNIDKPESLGMQLVYDLARQLNGSVDISSGKGASVTVAF